jgi:TetR/AcrR family transcriptional regulator, repressor of the mexAB-oprM multidrug resistance operon
MRRTKTDAEKTKVAILDAGTRIFARCGFERAALEAIGREARLTRGAIYWHFKNKRDLFAQILRREDDRLDRLVASALSADGSSFDKLRRLLDAVVDNFYGQETFRQFIELTWYKLGPSQFAPIMDGKKTFVQNFLALMQRLLGEALAARDIRPGTDVHLAALHLSCLINGLYRLYHVAPDWARDKKKAKSLFDDFLNSIAAGPGAPGRP